MLSVCFHLLISRGDLYSYQLSLYHIAYFFWRCLLIDRVPFLVSGTEVFDWSYIDGSCLLSRIGERSTTICLFTSFVCVIFISF